jgi:hypothetical protein
VALPAGHRQRHRNGVADDGELPLWREVAAEPSNPEEIDVLTADQKAQYESMRQTALADLEAIDDAIASELTRVKKRLLELQEDKKAVRQILDGVSARLGMPPLPPLKDLNLTDLGRPGAAPKEMPSAHSRPVGVP